jgi:hypothetical protein
VHRRNPELWPIDWILHHDNAPAHKALSVKQFLTQILITEMEHPPHSSDLALNDFWLFPKIKPALMGQRLHDTEDSQKNVTVAVLQQSSKNFSNSGSITGLSA